MKKIQYLSVSFGADPEFFFKQNGAVIGAEKVLPKNGVMRTERFHKLDENGAHVLNEDGLFATEERPYGSPLIIIDGVQAELNVVPNHCRQSFSTNISICFRKIAEQIHGKDIIASFAQTVEVDKEEMQTLSKDAQQFGCAPSKNVYGRTKVEVKDASKYYSRSAGGHIHIGHGSNTTVKNVLANTDITIPILDIIVGNTCVLIDRDPGNIERRKNYGRAGEYRLPKHGLEYRTLSNFWLRSYQTMSLVMALVRFAVCVAGDEAVSKELLALVDLEKIARAINENDVKLAQENFESIRDFLSNISVSGYETRFPLEGERIDQFSYFANKGLDYWFKDDIMEHWCNHQYQNRYGWEEFAARVVAKKMPVPTKRATTIKSASLRGLSFF